MKNYFYLAFSKAILGVLLLMIMAIAGVTAFCAYGGEEIKKIKLNIVLDEDEESGYSCIENGRGYFVDEVNLISGQELSSPGPATANMDFCEIEQLVQASSEKILEVVLLAEDGYQFGTFQEKDFTLKGLGEKCLKAKRRDGRKELILEIKLKENKRHKKISEAWWQNSASGMAEWSPSDKDCIYRVFLYKNGSALGDGRLTSGTKYDFSALMAEPGEYKYTVQALDEEDHVYSTKKSPALYYNGAMKHSDPDSEEIIRDSDGVPYQNNWYNDGKWHFCDEDGHMKKNTWFCWRGKPYMVDEEGVWTESEKSIIMNS